MGERRHLVEARWWCDCGDINRCRLERYVSDVRILEREKRMTEAWLVAGVLFAVFFGGLVVAFVAVRQMMRRG
jgi:hypothetical protein